MAKRLMLITNSATISFLGRDLITEHLKSRGWQLWHWFEDLWLVSGVPNDLSVNQLRDQILDAVPNSHFLIVSPDENAVIGGVADQRAIHWILEAWNKAGE